MQQQEVYRREDYWRAFLAWEHEARRVIHGRRDSIPGDDVPDSEDDVFYKDGEDADEEGDNEMEGAPSATVKLKAVLLDNYDKDVATTGAMAASLVDEEAKWSWPGLEDIVQLPQMVAEHVAFLPPPLSLPPHAPPQAAWDGQDVPPPPPPTPRQFAPPLQYALPPPHDAEPAKVPVWSHQLWKPPPFIDLVLDDEEDDGV
jgi:hypothetical protein